MGGSALALRIPQGLVKVLSSSELHVPATRSALGRRVLSAAHGLAVEGLCGSRGRGPNPDPAKPSASV
jgi:hypothetical protein